MVEHKFLVSKWIAAKKGVTGSLMQNIVVLASAAVLIPVSRLILDAVWENKSELGYTLFQVLITYIAPLAVFAFVLKRMFSASGKSDY